MTGTEGEDVIVIGASTAGLFAAYRLAQAGVPVRVLEKLREMVPAYERPSDADERILSRA